MAMTKTKNQSKPILSFDIGGTYIKYGIVNDTGEIVHEDRFETPPPSAIQGEKIEQSMQQITIKMQKQYAICGIGISAHGVVDYNQQIVTCSANYLPGLKNIDFSSRLQRMFNVPVIMDNDGNTAALGEYWHGNAENYASFVFVVLGTSIGGGIVLNGQLWRGLHNRSGELGYLITHETDKTERFIPGAWEAYASAASLIRRYRAIKKDEMLTEHDFNQDLINNDLNALKVLQQYAHSVASGLLGLVHVLAPEAVILGGAITRMGSTLLEPVTEEFRLRALDSVKNTPILTARLGNRSGMIGAALNVKRYLETKG